jgi:hypothetical protein
MAQKNPDKPAADGVPDDAEKKVPKKQKPSAASKKTTRAKKSTPKAKTAPKATKSRTTRKTKSSGEKAAKKPKSSPAKTKPAAAKSKKSAAVSTQKIESEKELTPFSSADNSVTLPPKHEEPDTMNRMLIYGGGILALFVFLILAASLQNMGKYEIVENNGAVEVWKGRFSPIGTDLVISMKGVEPPSQKKEIYTREDIYPIVFQYYLDKSDAMIAATGSPGFEEIKASLQQASAYALTAADRSQLDRRIKTIDRTVLIYKADVVAAKGTPEGLQSARVYLNKAATLKPDEIEANLIQHKLESVQKQMEAIRPELAGKPKAPKAAEEVPPPTPKTDENESAEPAPEEKADEPVGGTT